MSVKRYECGMSNIKKERIAELANFKPSGSNSVNSASREEWQELARIALASLEAEPVGYMNRFTGRVFTLEEQPGADTDAQVYVPVYTAPPATVSVPAAMEMDDDFDSAFEHGKAVGWNARHAAMLQGAEQPQSAPQNIPENIPVTLFKPVADLYGLTSPTGSETSFTFDAVEARDFIDGGWSCQEYVELERYQQTMAGNSPVVPDEWRSVLSEMVDAMRRYEMDVAGECDTPPRHRRMMHRAEQLLGIGVQEESHD